jgi:hypothetical protein
MMTMILMRIFPWMMTWVVLTRTTLMMMKTTINQLNRITNLQSIRQTLDAFFILVNLPACDDITEVKSKADKKAFLDVARIIYKDDTATGYALWIMILRLFLTRQKTTFITHGKATRWILN